MTVTAVDKDPTTRTMRITAEFDAPVERVWQLWSDPRLLERWWGPPTYPATFDEHDLTPGGTIGVPHDRNRTATSRTAGGRCSWSTRRAISSSRTASPTPTAHPTPTCRRCT